MKVRFHDCDPFNHLNNSRYIDYFMAARGDQLLDHYGFDINAVAQQQSVGWVSATTQISYLSPAVFMEEVLIETRLLEYTGKSLLFEAIMYSAGKVFIKAVMWSKLVHFHLTARKSHQHSPALMDFFAQVVYPLETASSFEDRIQTLLNKP
jgi:acyl-CoA thioester hydrolase